MSEQNSAKISTVSKSFNILSGIKFIIISYIVSLILILALTALIVYTDVPEKAGTIGVGVITFFGSFLSAYLCGRTRKRGGLIYGALNGGLNIAGLLLIGFAIYGSVASGQDISLKILGGCLSGALGGIFGVNTGKE